MISPLFGINIRFISNNFDYKKIIYRYKSFCYIKKNTIGMLEVINKVFSVHMAKKMALDLTIYGS